MSKRILILYTGGTIGMIQDPVSGILRPFDLEQILAQVPEISIFGYQLDAVAFEQPIDSSNMTPEIWIHMANIIGQHYHTHDGFVILHGSDTMAYTASALSFLLENLDKCVVLTGSQLPIGHVRTDAKENLITSIEIAAACDEHGNSRVPEVCLYFDYQLYRGNRVIKYNAEKFEAFHSPNYPPLAEAGIRIRYHSNAILPKRMGGLKVHRHMSTAVGSLKLFPGLSAMLLNQILHTPGMDVMLIEGFGAGNAPTAPWFTQTLGSFIQKGGLVVDITQCHGGSVELGKYETSAALLQMGVISGHDLTFEAAICKSMFLLGLGWKGEKFTEAFGKSLSGELSKF
ncbi:MAG: L-asparaginase 1 [Sphingobacteriaceae bacterium]|nr:L-asparaginase 1 [Sphingobacteriaceae bacterium]